MRFLAAKMRLPLLIAVLTALFSLPVPAPGQARMVDRVVAVVNNDIVKLSELEQAIAPYVKEIQSRHLDFDEEQALIFKLREEAINGLIERKLVDQETQRLGIKVDDKDLDAYLEQLKQDNHMTGEDLATALKAQGLTMEDFRKAQRESLLRARLMEREVSSRIVITEEDIKKFYDENKDKYEGKYNYHIWSIAAPPGSGGEGRERLLAARTALAQSGSITATAKKFESGEPRIEFTDLGMWILSDLAPFYQEKVAVMKQGDISDVLETPNGNVVIYLDSVKKSAGRTLAEATPEIRRAIYGKMVDEHYVAWVDSLKKKAHIKIIR